MIAHSIHEHKFREKSVLFCIGLSDCSTDLHLYESVWFELWLLFLVQLPTNECNPGGSRWWLRCLGPCHPWGRPGWGPWLLAFCLAQLWQLQAFGEWTSWKEDLFVEVLIKEIMIGKNQLYQADTWRTGWRARRVAVSVWAWGWTLEADKEGFLLSEMF